MGLDYTHGHAFGLAFPLTEETNKAGIEMIEYLLDIESESHEYDDVAYLGEEKYVEELDAIGVEVFVAGNLTSINPYIVFAYKGTHVSHEHWETYVEEVRAIGDHGKSAKFSELLNKFDFGEIFPGSFLGRIVYSSVY